jgi:hypothetical protein
LRTNLDETKTRFAAFRPQHALQPLVRVSPDELQLIF